MYKLLYTVLIITTFSCVKNDNKEKLITESNNEYTYVGVLRSHDIDTVYWVTLNIDQSDSFFIYKAIEYFRHDKNEHDLKLPKDKGFFEEYGFELYSSKEIKFRNQKYEVLKYVTGQEIDDGLMFYFYLDKVGFINYKSASWGTYYRLYKTKDEKINELVFYLNEKIISDNTFFSEYKYIK